MDSKGRSIISKSIQKRANIDRVKLTNLIYKRLEKNITKKDIRLAIDIICEEIASILIDKEALSISNFGTLNPYLFHSHNGINVQTGEMQIHKKFWSVKFHAHNAFENLLREKKHIFTK